MVSWGQFANHSLLCRALFSRDHLPALDMSFHNNIEHFTCITRPNDRVAPFEPLYFETIQQANLFILIKCLKQINALQESKFCRPAFFSKFDYNLLENVTV